MQLASGEPQYRLVIDGEWHVKPTAGLWAAKPLSHGRLTATPIRSERDAGTEEAVSQVPRSRLLVVASCTQDRKAGTGGESGAGESPPVAAKWETLGFLD